MGGREVLLVRSELPGLPAPRRGKVRDIYDLGSQLLIVATDRVSAFDVVLPDPIPDKGRVLTGLTVHWFARTREIVANHLLTADFAEFPAVLAPFRAVLAGRSMLVRKAQVLPVECVVRGYLAGSAWKEYRTSGRVGEHLLPPGLRESERLPEPLFTPTTKAATGHDEPLTFAQVERLIGRELAARVRDLSLALYRFGAARTEERGIVLADTKFEFGLVDGELLVVDEILTPDSSRFWPLDGYAPGGPQPSFDKQFIRDYLEQSGWDKRPPAPSLPTEVIAGTAARYREAYRRLVGRELGGEEG
ncbi:MAG: phosphoribosylaminoimidazolesuccinocarboxamide synthase [Firmicutes bacterium]|nr:phosphoribosylaminoimidazolesuccinocarboxamide synthase [Bacillota bacterium]